MPSPPRPDVEGLLELAQQALGPQGRPQSVMEQLLAHGMLALLTYLRAVEIENDTLKNVMPVEIARQRQTIIDLESDNASLIEQFEKDQALLRAVEGERDALGAVLPVESADDVFICHPKRGIVSQGNTPGEAQRQAVRMMMETIDVAYEEIARLTAAQAPTPPDAAAVERVARAIYEEYRRQAHPRRWRDIARAALSAAALTGGNACRRSDDAKGQITSSPTAPHDAAVEAIDVTPATEAWVKGLEDMAAWLDAAPLHGTARDHPEGSRQLTLSDALARLARLYVAHIRGEA